MSRLHRSYIGPNQAWVDDRVTLDERESHHLAKALRVRAGDEIETFNGRGETRLTRVASVSSSSVELISEEIRTEFPEAPAFELGVAVPKGKKMDEIVRQVTEMGAARVTPLITERTEGSDDPLRRESKRRKWCIGAIEACKQSGNAFVPEIDTFPSLEDWLDSLPSETFKLVASLESDAKPLRNWLSDAAATLCPPNVALLIGPEGDLSPDEYSLVKSRGFLPCTFGRNVLRVDTAVVCAFAVAKEEFGRYLARQPINPIND